MPIDPNQLAAWRRNYEQANSPFTLGGLCMVALPQLLDEVEALQAEVARLNAEAKLPSHERLKAYGALHDIVNAGYRLTVTIDATAPGAAHGARGMGNTIAEAVASLREQLEKLK